MPLRRSQRVDVGLTQRVRASAAKSSELGYSRLVTGAAVVAQVLEEGQEPLLDPGLIEFVVTDGRLVSLGGRRAVGSETLAHADRARVE